MSESTISFDQPRSSSKEFKSNDPAVRVVDAFLDLKNFRNITADRVLKTNAHVAKFLSEKIVDRDQKLLLSDLDRGFKLIIRESKDPIEDARKLSGIINPFLSFTDYKDANPNMLKEDLIMLLENESRNEVLQRQRRARPQEQKERERKTLDRLISFFRGNKN